MPALSTKDRVATIYGHLAGFYDRLRPLFAGPPGVTEDALDVLDLPDTGRVLDVACGTGFGAKRLRGRSREVHSIDLTRELLIEARQQQPLDDVAFVQGDAERLPYADETFDVITIIGAIQHFPNPDLALAEARRVMRTDGVLFVGAPKRPENGIAARITDRLFDAWTPESAVQRLQQAGWVDVELETIPIDWTGRSILAVTARAD